MIWYQGESDGNRPWDYPLLFPFMIQQWRSEWNQGNFPFYWFQLPKYDNGEHVAPFQGSWAEIREAQSKALSLPNTGQVVLIDQGETSNIHPHRKAEVAARIARVALARDYGIKIPIAALSSRVSRFPATRLRSPSTVLAVRFISTIRPKPSASRSVVPTGGGSQRKPR